MAAFTDTRTGAEYNLAEGALLLEPIAHEHLAGLAATYGAYTTYGELGALILDRAGLTTSMSINRWIGHVLGAVVAGNNDRGEPPMTSLVVNKATGEVGTGYAVALAEHGMPLFSSDLERERHAAASRLLSYRHFGAKVPEDATPQLTPKHEASLKRRDAAGGESESRGERVRNVWWVNQGGNRQRRQTFSVLWAAYANVAGRPEAHWDSLDEMLEGDLVLHYAHGSVRGSSRVRMTATPVVRPADFEIDGRAGDLGRQVVVEYQEFDLPVALDSIPVTLRSAGGDLSPFTSDGAARYGFAFRAPTAVAEAVFAAANLISEPSIDGDLAVEPDSGHTEMTISIGELDGRVTVRYRKEQGALRGALLAGRSSAECGICGRSLPTNLLHAAHIKPRSVATDPERRNLDNLMLACVLGCDTLFELGYIAVGEDGIIGPGTQERSTDALEAARAVLIGSRAPAFTDASAPFFAAKRQG